MRLQKPPIISTVLSLLRVCASRCELPTAATSPYLPACCHSPCHDAVPLEPQAPSRGCFGHGVFSEQ